VTRPSATPRTLQDVLERILAEHGHPSLAELREREAAKLPPAVTSTPKPPPNAPPPPPSHHEREPGEDDNE